jgi:hypothetical protein
VDANPYQTPNVQPDGNDPRSSIIKYIVATVGALLVFLGALAALTFAVGALMPMLTSHFAVVLPVHAMALIGAILAAIASFRGTLRTYNRK